MTINLTKYATLAATMLATTSAFANIAGGYTGSVSGSFSNAVLSGTLVDAATGTPLFSDNSLSSICSIVPVNGGCAAGLIDPATNGFYPSNTLVWGTENVALNHSTLTFSGANFSGVAADQRFRLGTLTYTNGTSFGNTVIFGALLTLNFDNVDFNGNTKQVDSLPINISITTTLNSGTPDQNADFVGFAGNNILSSNPTSTFNVLEGFTAGADLFGAIVGDPYGTLLDIQLADGTVVGSAFIGNGLPVPEPAMVSLLGLGILGVGAVRRRAR